MSRLALIIFTLISSVFSYAEKPKLVPPVPLSECFEGLKTLSSQQGWGAISDGKSIILGRNYIVDYGYNEKTKKHIPVLIQINGDDVIVVTPAGTAKTSGRNCQSVSKKTSLQLIADWIEESDKNLDEIYNVAKMLKMGSNERKTYDSSVAKNVLDYKKILESCKNSGFSEVENAATSTLSRLSGSSGQITEGIKGAQ